MAEVMFQNVAYRATVYRTGIVFYVYGIEFNLTSFFSSQKKYAVYGITKKSSAIIMTF